MIDFNTLKYLISEQALNSKALPACILFTAYDSANK